MATNSEGCARSMFPGRATWWSWFAIGGAALVMGGAAGCVPAQVSELNREHVRTLATATSAENPEWVEECAREVEAARTQGTLSESEFAAFSAIIEEARAGNWERARQRAYALREAQKPTPEGMETVKNRTLPPLKEPPGSRARGVP